MARRWQIINEKLKETFYNFLSENELYTLDFFSTLKISNELLATSSKFYLAEFIDDKVNSILFMTKNGYIIFYTLEQKFIQERANEVKFLIDKYCKSKLQFIFPFSYRTFFSKYFKINSIFNYYIMLFNPVKLKIPVIDSRFIFKVATLDDIQILSEIHYNYLVEEVYSKDKKINRSIIPISLKKIIEENSLYYIYDKIEKKVVSKININLETENIIRLGGVYTDKKFRKNNLAKYLIYKFLNQYANKEKQITLFVKTNNIKAYSLYSKANFEIISKSSTIYF